MDKYQGMYRVSAKITDNSDFSYFCRTKQALNSYYQNDTKSEKPNYQSDTKGEKPYNIMNRDTYYQNDTKCEDSYYQNDTKCGNKREDSYYQNDTKHYDDKQYYIKQYNDKHYDGKYNDSVFRGDIVFDGREVNACKDGWNPKQNPKLEGLELGGHAPIAPLYRVRESYYPQDKDGNEEKGSVVLQPAKRHGRSKLGGVLVRVIVSAALFLGVFGLSKLDNPVCVRISNGIREAITYDLDANKDKELGEVKAVTLIKEALEETDEE